MKLTDNVENFDMNFFKLNITGEILERILNVAPQALRVNDLHSQPSLRAYIRSSICERFVPRSQISTYSSPSLHSIFYKRPNLAKSPPNTSQIFLTVLKIM